LRGGWAIFSDNIDWRDNIQYELRDFRESDRSNLGVNILGGEPIRLYKLFSRIARIKPVARLRGIIGEQPYVDNSIGGLTRCTGDAPVRGARAFRPPLDFNSDDD